MPAELAQVELEPVSHVSDAASVCHFDEVGEPLQETVVTAHERGRSTITVEPFRAALIEDCDCDVVKFTDYYRVSRV